MKATFELPDELYRDVKAETAREGRTVREVTIGLFEQWLREKKLGVEHVAAMDWISFQAPLSHLVPEWVGDHSLEGMRESMKSDWNEGS